MPLMQLKSFWSLPKKNEIGQMPDVRQKAESWGAAVIPRQDLDIRNELPGSKGFPEDG
jgi:hypothetical protein